MPLRRKHALLPVLLDAQQHHAPTSLARAPAPVSTMASAPRVRFYFDFISHNAALAWFRLQHLSVDWGFTVQPVPVVFAGFLKEYNQMGPAEVCVHCVPCVCETGDAAVGTHLCGGAAAFAPCTSCAVRP